jgi:hypothetical protein
MNLLESIPWFMIRPKLKRKCTVLKYVRGENWGCLESLKKDSKCCQRKMILKSPKFCSIKLWAWRQFEEKRRLSYIEKCLRSHLEMEQSMKLVIRSLDKLGTKKGVTLAFFVPRGLSEFRRYKYRRTSALRVFSSSW